MTTKQALKCIKEDFKVIKGSWQEQAVERIEYIINRTEDIISDYELSLFDDDGVKRMSFNEIVIEFKLIFDDLSKIKNLML